MAKKVMIKIQKNSIAIVIFFEKFSFVNTL